VPTQRIQLRGMPHVHERGDGSGQDPLQTEGSQCILQRHQSKSAGAGAADTDTAVAAISSPTPTQRHVRQRSSQDLRSPQVP
jgi:hypothetical protein